MTMGTVLTVISLSSFLNYIGHKMLVKTAATVEISTVAAVISFMTKRTVPFVILCECCSECFAGCNSLVVRSLVSHYRISCEGNA